MEITSSIWEGLFVKILGMENTKDIIIGNIYRPPYDNNCKENTNSFKWITYGIIKSIKQRDKL